ncbi:MAG: hypothetical protein IPJ77_01880 [Planctomycetes bacterium]|nr:hypothetical protein [Planctomycetota bacterium]
MNVAQLSGACTMRAIERARSPSRSSLNGPCALNGSARSAAMPAWRPGSFGGSRSSAGTPMLWNSKSEKYGPPWQRRHAARPRKSASPRCAASGYCASAAASFFWSAST